VYEPRAQRQVGHSPAPPEEGGQKNTRPPVRLEVSNETLNYLGSHDEGNAQAMKLLHGHSFCFCDAYGWMHYTGTHWERQGAEGRLERAIIATLKRRRKAGREEEVGHVLKATELVAGNVRSTKFLFKSLVTRTVNEFDQSPDMLNVANGTIDLRTGALLPHDHALMLTYCIDIPYEKGQSWGEWGSFLGGALNQDLDLLAYLQKSVGYSLTGHTSEEVLWYIHGPSRSGKGTFTETLMALLGVPLTTEVDFGTFSHDRDNDANNFDLAPLKPARIVFASESDRHQRLNAAKVKALTGGNMVRCCFKHRDHFTYRPQYKIWLTSNYPPNADVDDDALWGRLRVMVFPNSHLGEEDKGLKHRLRTKESLAGVLAWAVEGAVEWYRQRDMGLETPQSVIDNAAAVRQEQDSLGQWLEECIERQAEAGFYIPNSQIYSSYTEWCEENGVTPKKRKAFTQALRARGVEGPKQKKVLGKNQRVWMDVRIKLDA